MAKQAALAKLAKNEQGKAGAGCANLTNLPLRSNRCHGVLYGPRDLARSVLVASWLQWEAQGEKPGGELWSLTLGDVSSCPISHPPIFPLRADTSLGVSGVMASSFALFP